MDKGQSNTYLHFGSKYATAFIWICRTQPEIQILRGYMSLKQKYLKKNAFLILLRAIFSGAIINMSSAWQVKGNTFAYPQKYAFT